MSLAEEDRRDCVEDRHGLSPSPVWTAVDPTGTANERDRICLIVDDHPALRTLLGIFLKRRGLATLEAANAAEALAIVQSLQGRLDLIITDILMPGEMDGLNFAYSVRQRFPGIPVILASGYGGDDSNIGSYGFPFIAKPYRSEKLWDLVERELASAGTGRHRQLDSGDRKHRNSLPLDLVVSPSAIR